MKQDSLKAIGQLEAIIMVVNVDSKKYISRDFNVSHIGNHLPLMKSSLSSHNSIELFTQFYREGRDIVSLRLGKRISPNTTEIYNCVV